MSGSSGSSSKKRRMEDEREAFERERKKRWEREKKFMEEQDRKREWDDLLEHTFSIDNNLKIKRELYQNHEDMILKNVKQYFKEHRLTSLFEVLKGVKLTFDMFLEEIYNINEPETLYKWRNAYVEAKLISEEEIYRLGKKMPFREILTDGGKFNALKGMVEGFLPFNDHVDLHITPSVKIILHTAPTRGERILCRMNVRYNFEIVHDNWYTLKRGMKILIKQQKENQVRTLTGEPQRFNNDESNTIKIVAEWDYIGYDESNHTLTHEMDYFLCNNEVSDVNHILDGAFFTLDRFREFQKQMSLLIPKHFALLCGIYFPDSKTRYSKEQEFPYKATNDKIFTPDWFSSDLLNDKRGFLKLLDSKDLDNKYLLYDAWVRVRGRPVREPVEIKSIEKKGLMLKLDLKANWSEEEEATDYLDVYNFSIGFTPNEQQTEEIIFKDIMLKYNVPLNITKKTKMLNLMNLKF